MTVIHPLEAWPPGSSPFSREFHDLINTYGEVITWVLSNQGDLEDLLVRPFPPHPKLPGPLFAVVTFFTEFAVNRWEYTWDQAEFDPSTRLWGPRPDGILSVDEGETFALNNPEFENRTAKAAHGVALQSVLAIGAVEPIPVGTPILLHLAPLPVGTPPGTNFRVFHEVNAVNFDCTP